MQQFMQMQCAWGTRGSVEFFCSYYQEVHYGGTSIIRTSLRPYQTVLIIEVSLVRRLVQSMHSIVSHTPQSVALTCTCTTEITQMAKRRLKRGLTEKEIAISDVVNWLSSSWSTWNWFVSTSDRTWGCDLDCIMKFVNYATWPFGAGLCACNME